MKEAILEDFVERANNNVDGDFLHLATALDPQWKDLKVNNKSGREGCWRKLRAELDLHLPVMSTAKRYVMQLNTNAMAVHIVTVTQMN